MSRYLDGVLSENAARRFEAHLAKCSGCRRKVAVLQSAARACRLPKRRLDAISENVMARVGQVANLPEGKRLWQTDSPILGEIQSTEGTVFIRNARNDKAIEAFPGCALRRGDSLEPVTGGSAVIQWENGATLHITEPTDMNLLATAMTAVAGRKWLSPFRSGFSLRAVQDTWNRLTPGLPTWGLVAFLRQCDRTERILATSIVAVLGAIIVMTFGPSSGSSRQIAYVASHDKSAVAGTRTAGGRYTYVGTTAGTLTTDDAIRAKGGNWAAGYDIANGTVRAGDTYRVKAGWPYYVPLAVTGESYGGNADEAAKTKLPPVISCIPDIIISDAERNSATDRNFFVFENALDLDQFVRDGTEPSSILRWSFVQPTPGKLLSASQGSAEQNQQAPTTPSKSPAPKTTPTSSTTEKHLVIYTAQFSILVGSVEDAMKDLAKRIEEWKGYVQTADLRRVTFRVPAVNFDRAVEEISRLGVVTAKQVQSQDVTRQFMDVRLRIEVAEASRKRLLALLEKADTTEALLKIENEIRRLTEEIERMKGDLRTLGDQIVYSTITVDFSAKAAEAKQAAPRRGGLSYFAWINQIGAENVLRCF
jgi:hypothetical protein